MSENKCGPQGTLGGFVMMYECENGDLGALLEALGPAESSEYSLAFVSPDGAHHVGLPAGKTTFAPVGGRPCDPLVTVHASTVVAPGEVWLLATIEGDPDRVWSLVVPLSAIGAGPWPAAFARYRMAFGGDGVVTRLSEP